MCNNDPTFVKVHLESYTPGLWRYIPVHTGTYRHVLFYSTRRYVLTWVWRKVVYTGTYRYVLKCAKWPKVRTSTYFCGLWRYMAVHGSTCGILSRYMAVHGGTWHYFLLSITVYGSTWRYKGWICAAGGAVPPADFRALLKALHCLHYPWQLPQVIASTNSSIHALVLVCLGPPLPWARLCHLLPASSPLPPRVQPRQQPRLPRASSGGLGGLVVINGVGRCTVTESMTRLKR